MATFAELAKEFTRLNETFSVYEKELRDDPPKKRKDHERRLKELGKHLAAFSDLQFQMLKLAVVQDTEGRRASHIQVIDVVMNKIQFLYMVPFSMELSRKYNIFNIRLAVFSIIAGALLGMMQPYIQPQLEKLYCLITVDKEKAPRTKLVIPSRSTKPSVRSPGR